MSRRAERVAATIRRLLQERMTRGLNDPRVRGLVTITGVELVDDLRTAKVTVSVLPREHAPLTLHGLRAAAGTIRRDVMRRMHIRDMPALRFVIDEGHQRSAEVLGLIALDRERREAEGDTFTPAPWSGEDGTPIPRHHPAADDNAEAGDGVDAIGGGDPGDRPDPGDTPRDDDP